MDLLNMTNTAQIREFLRRLNKGNFFLLSHKGMEVAKKCKILAQYLPNFAR